MCDALNKTLDRNKIIWFCANIKHAEMISQTLFKYGEDNSVYHSDLNQEERKQDILALLYDPNQAIPGWTEDQRNNMIRIIENWLHVHPFHE